MTKLSSNHSLLLEAAARNAAAALHARVTHGRSFSKLICGRTKEGGDLNFYLEQMFSSEKFNKSCSKEVYNFVTVAAMQTPME